MATVTKEIAKGIFLHKTQQPANDNLEGIEFLYVFKIEVRSLQILEFNADFNGSENLVMEGSPTLSSSKTINPMSEEIVAILKLKKNWKLKSRFKFTMRNPTIEVQQEHLMPDIIKLENQIKVADKYLSNYPYEIMSTEALENQVKQMGMKFIDIDFLPIESSIYNPSGGTPFDVIIHWRRPEEFMAVDYNQGLLEPSIFYDSVEPNDIREGSLGNPWFTSALATLAERPALIERLFVTKEVNKNGIYKIRI